VACDSRIFIAEAISGQPMPGSGAVRHSHHFDHVLGPPDAQQRVCYRQLAASVLGRLSAAEKTALGTVARVCMGAPCWKWSCGVRNARKNCARGCRVRADTSACHLPNVEALRSRDSLKGSRPPMNETYSSGLRFASALKPSLNFIGKARPPSNAWRACEYRLNPRNEQLTSESLPGLMPCWSADAEEVKMCSPSVRAKRQNPFDF